MNLVGGSELRLAAIMREARAIAPDDPLDVTERLLRRQHARHWPVAVDERLVGVVSLRDVLPQRRQPLKAEHVMLRALAVAHPDDTPAQAAAQMLEHRLSCLPVVEEGRLLAVVQLDDLVKLAVRRLRDLGRERGAPARVAELMTAPPVATVETLDTLETAEQRLRLHNVRHLPVLHHGRLAGIVSDRDLAEASSPELCVGEVMTASPMFANPDDDAIDGALVMLVQHIGALPVVSGQVLVGILTKSDFLRRLVCS
jgi:CBS domain-containing protein